MIYVFKKIFPFVLCLCLLFVSVFGSSSVKAVDYSDTLKMVDLLAAGYYEVYGYADGDGESVSNVDPFTVNLDIPYFSEEVVPRGSEGETVRYSDLEFISFYWEPLNQVVTSQLYLYVFQRGTMSVEINGQRYSSSFAGEFDGYFSQYVTFKPQQVHSIKISFTADSGSTFSYPRSILSVFTFPSIRKQVVDGEIQVDLNMADYNDSLGEWVTFYDRIVDAPLSLQTDKDYSYYIPIIKYEGYWLDNFHKVEMANIHLVFDMYTQAASDVLDSVYLTFASMGTTVFHSAYVSPHLSEYKNTGYALEASLYYADLSKEGMDGVYKDYEANGWNMYIDTTGVNFRQNKYLHIMLQVQPLKTNYEYDTYTYFELLNCEYSYTIASDFTPSIVISNLNTMIRYLTFINGNAESIDSTLVQNHLEITSYLDSIIESLNASSSQQQEIDQGKEQMQTQAGELSDLNDVMGSVERPNVDFSDAVTDVGGTILPNNYLSYVVNEPHVYAILGTVCLLMVISFIFFGRKR